MLCHALSCCVELRATTAMGRRPPVVGQHPYFTHLAPGKLPCPTPASLPPLSSPPRHSTTVARKALLERAAGPPEPPGSSAGDSSDSGNGDGDKDGPGTEEMIRSLSEEAVHLAVREMVGSDGGGGSGGGEDGGGGCVSEDVLREEVDMAIGKLMADGTGLRDFANAAVGGKVVRRTGGGVGEGTEYDVSISPIN